VCVNGKYWPEASSSLQDTGQPEVDCDEERFPRDLDGIVFWQLHLKEARMGDR